MCEICGKSQAHIHSVGKILLVCTNNAEVDLKYWHFVGDLGLELHLLGVVELEQEVGGKTAVKA